MPGDDFARPMNRRLSLPERLAFRQRFVCIFSLGERGVVGVRLDARLARRSFDAEGLLLTRLGEFEPVGPREQMRAIIEKKVQKEVEPPCVVAVRLDLDGDAAGLERPAVRCLGDQQVERPGVAVVVEMPKLVGNAGHHRLIHQADGDFDKRVVVLVLVVRVKAHASTGQDRIVSGRHAAGPLLLDPERLLCRDASGFQRHTVSPREQMRAVIEEEIQGEVEAPGIAVAERRQGGIGESQDVDVAGSELAAAHRLDHDQGERPRVAVIGKVAQEVGQLRHDRTLVAQPDLDLDESIIVLVVIISVKAHAREREERIGRRRNRWYRDAGLSH